MGMADTSRALAPPVRVRKPSVVARNRMQGNIVEARPFVGVVGRSNGIRFQLDVLTALLLRLLHELGLALVVCTLEAARRPVADGLAVEEDERQYQSDTGDGTAVYAEGAEEAHVVDPRRRIEA